MDVLEATYAREPLMLKRTCTMVVNKQALSISLEL